MIPRKLRLVRSVLTAVADRLMHGSVERVGFFGIARYWNRCDDCGLGVNVGDEYEKASRPGMQPDLYVHAHCPTGDVLFRLIPWLSEMYGSPILTHRFPAKSSQKCQRDGCIKSIKEGDLIGLVRRPGPLVRYKQHSDYWCETCVKDVE